MADFASQPLDYGAIMGQAQGLAANPIADQQAMVNLQNSRLAGAQVSQQMGMQRLMLQRQMNFGTELGNYVKNPTPEGLATLFGKYPEFEKQAADARGALDRGDITQLGSAAALASKGDYNGAAQVVQDRIDAETRNGADPATIAQSQHVLNLLKSNDPQQQKGALGLLTLGVGIAVGPEKAAEFLKANGLSSEPIDLAMDHRLVTQQGNTVVGATPKLELATNTVTGESTGFNPYTGKFGADAVEGGQTTAPAPGGGGPASGGGAVAPAGAPRSVRNNNPGNLRATSFTKGLPGYQGTDNAGYAIFDSPQSGLAAQTALLSGRAYYGGGRKTVASIVSKWAPPKSAGGDNTSAQVANYISYVSKQLGVKPGDALTPQQLPQLAQAMSQFEAGATGHAGAVRVPPVASPQAAGGNPGGVPAPVAQTDAYHFGTPGLNTKEAPPGYAWNSTHTGVVPIPGSEVDPNANNPQEVEDLARNWLTTGQWGGGGGGMGGGNIPAPLKKQAMARASEIMQSIGLTADDLPKIRSEYGAAKTSLSNVTGLLSNLQASENALHSNAQQVWNMHRQLVTDGIIGGNPYLNSARLKYYENFGNAEQKAHVKTYLDAINAYSTEYSKFMTSANGMGGSAAPSDSAREQAGDLNDPSLPATAMLAHLRQGEIEAANKRAGVTRQKAQLETQLSSLLQPHNAPHAPATPAQPVNIPQGAVQMLKANPSLAPMFDQKYGAGKARQILGR